VVRLRFYAAEVSARLCAVAAFSLAAASAAYGQALPHKDVPATPLPRLVEFDNVPIRMRDGVLLRADIYLPVGSGRWPAVLIRTPYNRRAANTLRFRYFAEHGYAVVAQDVRGRHGSEGNFGSIAQEGPDGNDTIDWISRQPWSNGRVGMVGASYVGIVQWWAAVQNNPRLVTIFPLVSGDDEYFDRYYSRGGALKLAHRLVWLSENLTPPGLPKPAFESYIRHLPTRTADIGATTQVLGLWRLPLSHPSYDGFWTNLSIRSRIDRVNIPVCSMAGWFDNYVESDLSAFSVLSKRNVAVETWVGPWSHNLTAKYPTVDFGPTVSPHTLALQLSWFDKFLKGPKPLTRAEPTLHIFVIGKNTWRDEHEWPLARTKYTAYYLTSGGRANSSSGDGGLVPHFQEDRPPDHFSYDPANPVPTTGGAVCCNPKLMPPGPLDQTHVEKRDDVLVYTSAPLEDEMEVTGPIGATLYVATSANDTDFTAKLVDVYPDGRALLVTDGITRLRYRISLSKPAFVKRNAPYQIRVDAGVTSWVFLPGHRIRLEISSSNFPRFDRNLNSIRPISEETRITKAYQTVFHEARYPSALVLPVIPRVRSSTSTVYSQSEAKTTGAESR
jgi:predicted acyl esterase